MSAEAVDFVLARAERELADVRQLRIRLQGRLDEVEDMLDAMKAEMHRDKPPRPHLYLVR